MDNPFDALDEDAAPTAAPAASQNPFDSLDDQSDAGGPASPAPPASPLPNTMSALQQTDSGTTLPEVTISAERQPGDEGYKPDPSWWETIKAVPGAVANTFKRRLGTLENVVGKSQYNDAQMKMWQAMTLPQAVQEAKDAGVAITDLPYIQDTAKRIGVSVSRFAQDWPAYEGMSNQDAADFYRQQVQTMHAAAAHEDAGAARTAKADETPSPTFHSGLKGTAFEVLSGLPDLAVGMTASLGAGAVGGPAAAAATGLGYFGTTSYADKYHDLKAQGADDDTANVGALMAGASNAVAELPVMRGLAEGGKIGEAALTQALGKQVGSRASSAAATGLHQAVANTMITAVQQGVDAGLIDKHQTLGEALKELGDAFVVGGITGAGIGAAHGGPAKTPKPGRQEPTVGELPAAATPGEPTIGPLEGEVPRETLPQGAVVARPGAVVAPEPTPAPTIPSEPAPPASAAPRRAAPTETPPSPTGSETESTGEAPAATEKGDGYTRSALEAVNSGEWANWEGGEMEHLENQGLIRRNDLGEPRLLPAGRRELVRLQNQMTPEEQARQYGGGANTTPAPAETGGGLEKTSTPLPETTVAPSFQQQLEAAREDTNPNPTAAQRKSGKYAMGKVDIGGMTVAIESPAGSTRKGPMWNQKMAHDYGFIQGVKGADGDELDAFLTGKPDTGKAFVVNQVNPDTGKFDEHKVVIGADTAKEARKVYDQNYPKDWKGFQSIVEMPTSELKERAQEGEFEDAAPIPAERPAAVPEVIKTVRKAPPAPVPDASKDSALEFIAKHGGINLTEAESEGFDRKDLTRPVVGIKRAFGSKGMSIETAGEKWRDAGWDVTSRGADGQPALDRDKILHILDTELRGTKRYSTTRNLEAVESARQADEEYRRQWEADADEAFPNLPAQDHELAALRTRAEEIDPEGAKYARDADTEDEYRSILQRIVDEQQGKLADEARKDRDSSEGHRGSSPEEGPQFSRTLIESHTEEEVAARERAKKAADKKAADDRAAAEARAKADTEAKDFRLTGSDRPADVGMAGGQRPLFSRSEEPRDLIVQHNLSQENVLHAERMGGLPVPSVAITKAEHPLEGFGDVTLLGPKEMADPKGYARTKVHGSDIYSPRYPSVEHALDKAALRRLNQRLTPHRVEGERDVYGSDIRRPEDLAQRPDFKRMLEKEGISQDRWHDLQAAAEKELRAAGSKERIFRDFDYNGNRRYTPHTLENVVRILKKELRGGEGFNYGVGTLRAHYSPLFRTLKQIRDNRDLLVSKEKFEAVKKEVDGDFWKLAEKLSPYHSKGGEFGFGDVTINTLSDAAKMDLSRALRENGFEEVPHAVQQQAAEFLNHLRHLPTEYFEGKILRDVDLAEFRGAVVPHDAPAEVRKALESRGLTLKEYQRGDEADRKRAIHELASTHPDGLMFSRRDNTTGMNERDVGSVVKRVIRESTLAGIKDPPRIKIHQDYRSIPVEFRKDIVDNAELGSHTPGFFDPNANTVHLISDRLPNEGAIKETLWHEFAHAGLRYTMDHADWQSAMDGIWHSHPELVRQFGNRNSLDYEKRDDNPGWLTHRRLAAEEVLAYTAQDMLMGRKVDLERTGFVKRVIQAMKKFAYKVFRKPFLTDEDMLRTIAQARRGLTEGATTTWRRGESGRQSPLREAGIVRSGMAPTFYSPIERFLRDSKQAKASGSQWLATIKKQPGVKPEELEWNGVQEFLEANKDRSVTRAELQEHLAQNSISLEESHYGPRPDAEQSADEKRQTKLAEELRARGWQVDFNDLGEIDELRRPFPYSDGEETFFSPVDHLSEEERWNLPGDIRDTVEDLYQTSLTIAKDRLAKMTPAQEGWNMVLPHSTRYDEYTLPGGENYREMLLRKPSSLKGATVSQSSDGSWRVVSPGGSVSFGKTRDEAVGKYAKQQIGISSYKSSHWQEPNILAHVRFKDRTDADGKRVLFLEELQSDWHQAGRKKGYADADNQSRLNDIKKNLLPPAREAALDILRSHDRFGFSTDDEVLAEVVAHPDWAQPWDVAPGADREKLAQYAQLVREMRSREGPTVPDAPFKTTWPTLLMKRMIRYAAEHGYDRIAWTTGEQQYARYPGSVERLHGMQGFYDDILPRETNKLVGKFGSKVEDKQVHAQPDWVSGEDLINTGYLTRDEWLALDQGEHNSVIDSYRKNKAFADSHGFDITPQLRNVALGEGFPMFRRQRQQSLDLEQKRGAYERLRSAVEAVADNKMTEPFRKLFAPTTMDENAKRTARIATSALGNLAHNTFETQHALEAFADHIGRLPVEERLAMIDAIEKGDPQPNPALQPAADAMRKILDDWREKVRGLGEGYLDNFIENYFPHYWADPDEAKRSMASIFGRRPLKGPASFLKQRTIPTFKEGMDHGLTPLSTNPLILTLLKAREMQRFVSGVTMMRQFKDDGLAQFLPAGKPMPEGWSEINDNIARVRQWSEAENGFIERGKYIMPEHAATVINNHVGKSKLQGHLPVDFIRAGSNALNALQLGFSAFHLGFTTLDASISANALAIERLVEGNVTGAIAKLAEGMTPAGAVFNIRRGMKLMDAYTNPAGATPEMQKVVRALQAGGGRVHMDSWYRAIQGQDPFSKGFVMQAGKDIARALRGEEPLKELSGLPAKFGIQAWRELQEIGRTMPAWQWPFEVAGRVTRAFSAPIMEWIVPMQKLGVFSDMAQDYLKSHPDATDEQLATSMQSAWRSVDNRLGEMVYDNLFWDRTLKDGMHLSVRAVGWNLGTVREIGGAPADLLRVIDKAVTEGKVTREEIGHKIPYVIAMTMTTATVGAMLQYMMTGKGPQQLKDYFFPQTGGTTNQGTPERLSLPAYVKDIYEYSQHPGRTITNKLNPIISLTADLMQNENFFGEPIADPEANIATQLEQKGKYVLTEAAPFSITGAQQVAGAEKPGLAGKLKTAMPFIGLTPAPGYITSPEQQERRQRLTDEQSYLKSLNYQLKQARDGKDPEKIKDAVEQVQQAKQRIGQLQSGVNKDRGVAARARQAKANEAKAAGKPAMGNLIESLPLQPDAQAQRYFNQLQNNNPGEQQ